MSVTKTMMACGNFSLILKLMLHFICLAADVVDPVHRVEGIQSSCSYNCTQPSDADGKRLTMEHNLIVSGFVSEALVVSLVNGLLKEASIISS